MISQRCNKDEMSKNQSFLSTVQAGTPDHLPDIQIFKTQDDIDSPLEVLP